MGQDRDHDRRVIRAAQLYYGLIPGAEGGLTQEDIARRLDVHRTKVVRWLKEAAERFLEIRLRAPRPIEWEGRMLARWGERGPLREVRIIDGMDLPEEGAIEAVAEACGTLLASMLSDGERVGIGGGRTAVAAAAAFPAGGVRTLSIVPLSAGGPLPVAANTAVALLARRTADPDATRADGLYVPPIRLDARGNGARDQEAFLARPEIACVFKRARRIRTAIVGIGSLATAGDRRRAARYLAADDGWVREAAGRGAVGSILHHFIDREGRLVDCRLGRRGLSIPIDDLRAAAAAFPRRRTVLVAAGRGKGAAVAAAMRGGLVNVLVADASCAEVLLEEEQP
ncbi:MAG: hypothetical protein JXP34_24910 [Planctomycetes bacterium]|nr:hypothetical protein [Planctomycetota bacterium]